METKSKLPHVWVLMKILFSGVGIVDGRGKFGGSVASKGRSGAYVRNKVTGVNRRTSFQQAARVVLSLLSQSFRALSVAQINAWNAAALNGYTSTNIFGNSIKKTGLGLYVGLNANLRTIGLAILSEPPAQTAVQNMVDIAPSMDISATELFINGENSAGGSTVFPLTQLVILSSGPVSRGISFVSSQMRIIGTIAASADTATTNMWSAYVAKFGTPAAGQKIFIGVSAVSEVSGQAGVPLKEYLVAVA